MATRFGSLFSGIGGFDLGFERAGMQAAWQCEIDRDAGGVLARWWPGIENRKDVKDVRPGNVAAVDLICGGFPCQDLSVAGKRAGLAGSRSGLWFEFERIIGETKPQWVVIENVPGLLSSNRGRDFAVLLRGLVELGYGVGWRILDAQYFGVAQRRRRVFIVGSLGDGRAAEVLFERESGPGDTAPSREKGKGIAGTLDAKSASSNRGSQANEHEFVVPIAIQHAMIGRDKGGPEAKGWRQDGATWTLDGRGEADAVAYNQRGGYGLSESGDLSPTLQAEGGTHQGGPGRLPLVAYNIQHNDGGEHKRKDRPNGGLYVNETDTALTVGTTDVTAIAWEMQHASEAYRESGDIAPNLQARMGTGGNNVPMVGVRRLTPVECERLQGFPDGWTAGQSDSARYRQLGNAVCVPVAEWIARRIVDCGKEA